MDIKKDLNQTSIPIGEDGMITKLGKDGELVDAALIALNDRSFYKAFAGVLGSMEAALLRGLLSAYVYWSKQEGNAFREIKPFGYGFPYTVENSAKDMGSDNIKETMRITHRLKNMGFFNKTLAKGTGLYKVTYFFLNNDYIIRVILRCTEVLMERGTDTIKLKADITKAEAELNTAQFRLTEFREETRNIIFMKDIHGSLPIKLP